MNKMKFALIVGETIGRGYVKSEYAKDLIDGLKETTNHIDDSLVDEIFSKYIFNKERDYPWVFNGFLQTIKSALTLKSSPEELVDALIAERDYAKQQIPEHQKKTL